MAWDVPLEDLMADEVTVSVATTPGAYGESRHSTASATYTARVTFDPATIMRLAGETSDVSAVAWVASTTSFDRSAKITLPDGSTPPIKQVVRVDDGDGLHHVKVLFGGL